MPEQLPTPRLTRSHWIIMLAIGGVGFIVHLVTNGNYGIFRDELYYIACSEHLAFGYVDQPPLSIFILKGVRLLLGDSLIALRILPVLAGTVFVYLTGWIAGHSLNQLHF